MADLPHLKLLDKQNYTGDEGNYAGDRSVLKVEGIGVVYPGVFSMKNIAKQVFIVLNAAISK